MTEAGGLVVDEIEQGSDELLGLAEAAHGGGAKDLLGPGGGLALRIEEQGAVLIGDEEAGSQGVDANARLGKVHRQPLGQVGHRRLGAGIGRNLGQGPIGVHGGDVDDVGVLTHHILGEDLGGEQGGDDVEVKDEAHAVGIQVEEGLQALQVGGVLLVVRGAAGVVAAGAVEQQGAGAKGREHLFPGRAQALLVQTVGLHRDGLAAGGRDLIGHGLGRLQVQVQHGNLGPQGRQGLGKHGTKHAAAAGDHGHLIGQIHLEGNFHGICLQGSFCVA